MEEWTVYDNKLKRLRPGQTVFLKCKVLGSGAHPFGGTTQVVLQAMGRDGQSEETHRFVDEELVYTLDEIIAAVDAIHARTRGRT